MRYYVVNSTDGIKFLIVAESKRDVVDVCFDKAIEYTSITTLKKYTEEKLGSSYLSDVVMLEM